jgi:hypothetical protein
MEKFLKLVNTFILAGILVVMVLILVNLPKVPTFPSRKALLDAKDNKERFQELTLSIPFVEVQGTVPVEIQNPQLGVNVTNSELDVRVNN